MRTDGNHGGTIGYEPNSLGEWRQQSAFAEPPLQLEGAATRWDHRQDDDYYSQPGALFRLMDAVQRQQLFENTARALQGVPEPIQQRHIRNCSRADEAYGLGVASALEAYRQNG
jgi:catalase